MSHRFPRNQNRHFATFQNSHPFPSFRVLRNRSLLLLQAQRFLPTNRLPNEHNIERIRSKATAFRTRYQHSTNVISSALISLFATHTANFQKSLHSCTRYSSSSEHYNPIISTSSTLSHTSQINPTNIHSEHRRCCRFQTSFLATHTRLSKFAATYS